MSARRIVLLVPLVWVACFSASSGGNGNAQFDASFDSSFDGTSPEAEPGETSAPEASADVTAEDAPAVDASVEADAGPQPITVVVAGALGYEQGVNVVFGDVTGAVLGAPLQTDSHGRASTAQLGVAMATVQLGTPSAPSPNTVMGLVPGSLVPVVDLASIGSLPSSSAQVTAIPSTPNLGEVSTYQVTSGACVSTPQGPPFPLSLSNSAFPCVGLAATATTVNPVLPLVVDALDTSGNILGFAATTTASPATPDDAGNIDVALGGSWSQSTTHQIVAVDNLPDAGVFAPQIAYSEVADGILDTLPSHAPPVDAGASAFAQVQTHVGFASGVQAEAQLLSTQSGVLATSLISTGPAPTKDGTVTLDASPLATAPFFQSAVTTNGPTVGQPIVQWSLASGNLGGATGLVTSFGWSQPLDGGDILNGTWTLVSPGTTAASFTVPALPSSLAGYAPATGATVYVNEIFAVYGQTALGSYASLWPVGNLFPVQQCSFSAPAIPPLPGAGTALIVQYSAGGSGC
jgi:hypothetical protein